MKRLNSRPIILASVALTFAFRAQCAFANSAEYQSCLYSLSNGYGHWLNSASKEIQEKFCDSQTNEHLSTYVGWSAEIAASALAAKKFTREMKALEKPRDESIARSQANIARAYTDASNMVQSRVNATTAARSLAQARLAPEEAKLKGMLAKEDEAYKNVPKNPTTNVQFRVGIPARDPKDVVVLIDKHWTVNIPSKPEQHYSASTQDELSKVKSMKETLRDAQGEEHWLKLAQSDVAHGNLTAWSPKGVLSSQEKAALQSLQSKISAEKEAIWAAKSEFQKKNIKKILAKDLSYLSLFGSVTLGYMVTDGIRHDMTVSQLREKALAEQRLNSENAVATQSSVDNSAAK